LAWTGSGDLIARFLATIVDSPDGKDLAMQPTLIAELFRQIDALPIVDIHTHIDWKRPTARNIGDILSYHYYTELTHSAEAQPGESPEERFPFDDPEQLTQAIWDKLPLISNTVQYDWLMTISKEYLGLTAGAWRVSDGWQAVFRRSLVVMDRPEWGAQLLAQSHIRRVLLTNRYDEDLQGLDKALFSPCLRTESFLHGIHDSAEREQMAAFLGHPLRQVEDVAAAIDKAVAYFCDHGMAYAALSTPVNMRTFFVAEEEAQRLLDRVNEGAALDARGQETWNAYAIAQVCDACRRYGKPFHLMVGVNRNTYAHGVPSGMDLFDSLNSLSGFDYLFNAYPDVLFPTSVLADTTGLELTAAAWIRHNVFPSGHWWYSNQPTDIARELRRRLDVVPRNKLIGYYSDAYYLEFVLPKFRMFKFELATALAERMERSRIHPNMEPMTLEGALELAHEMLISNPLRILGLADL
jgi:glucuronate isomerase